MSDAKAMRRKVVTFDCIMERFRKHLGRDETPHERMWLRAAFLAGAYHTRRCIIPDWVFPDWVSAADKEASVKNE